MQFNKNLNWLKEDNSSDELLDIEDIDEIDESLYVDPSNYDNYDVLVDVVDSNGNPQKMTPDTYEKNKDSNDFKVVEKSDDEETQSHKNDANKLTQKQLNYVKDYAKMEVLRDIKNSANASRAASSLSGQFSPARLLSEEELKSAIDDSNVDEDTKNEILKKTLRAWKKDGKTTEPIGLAQVFNAATEMGFKTKDQELQQVNSAALLNLLPDKANDFLNKLINNPEVLKYDMTKVEDYANKGKTFSSTKNSIDILHNKGLITDDNFKELSSTLDKLHIMSKEHLSGAKQSIAKSDEQKQKLIDDKRKQYRDSNFKGTDSIKKALDMAINPYENGLSSSYEELQSKINNAIQREQDSGDFGSEGTAVRLLRKQQHELARAIASNLKDSSKDEVRDFINQYSAKSGLLRADNDNFMSQVVSELQNIKYGNQ